MNARQIARLALTAALASTLAGGLAAAPADVETQPAASTAAGVTVHHMVEAVHEGETGTLTMHQTDGARPAARKASASGYTLLSSGGVVLPAGGLTVVVDPKAPHRTMIAKIVREAVKAEAKGGLPVRWGGYATRAAKGEAVVVNEAQGGCSGTVLAVTGVSYTKVGNTMHLGGSTVHVCKRLLGKNTATKRAALFHEFGHAVGLAHFNGKYSSKRQIMNATVQPGNAGYQSGDFKGLRSVATKTRASN